MTRRALLAGRGLAILSLAALGIVLAVDGPRWLMVALLILAAAGFLIIAGVPSPGTPAGLTTLLGAIDELDRMVGPPAGSLNTDSTPNGLALAAARQVNQAADRIRLGLESARGRTEILTALLDAVEEPILATDAAGRILLCNAAAQELLDLRAGRFIGRPVEEAFTQPDFIAVLHTARGGSPARDEIRVPRPDGPRIWETAAVPYGPASPMRAVVMTIRDVTDRALALQVKSDFVANASHELRTPVSAIRMAAETLESLGPDDQAMRQRLVGMIASHTHRLEELIRDLLDLTRLEAADAIPHEEAVPASTLAADLGPMFEGQARDRRLSLRFDFQPDLEALRTDRNLLLLILGNLIDNACKFAFEGTEVLITGRRAEPSGTSVRFEVIDKGVGIPIHQQQRIFERFFQVDEARTGGAKRGTGLGLSIVKHAVRRLGGSIRVNSVWHRGTTMTVEIPRCLPAIGSDESPRRPDPAGERRSVP
jgi:two-component system, OmpR family, phosphate regulon sensor histidine kinase PhoR